MSPLFKREKKEKQKEEEKPGKERIKPAEKPKKEEKTEDRPLRAGQGEAWRVLAEPHITEKATALAENNQYVFKVFPRANKTEIKKAIENLFGVEVLGVRIIRVPRKKRRLGRVEGWRKGYKKAIVRIKEGQKIEVLPR